MKMKKTSATILALTLVFALAACGGSSNGSDDNSASSSTGAETAAPTVIPEQRQLVTVTWEEIVRESDDLQAGDLIVLDGYEWRVLEVQDEKVLVISQAVLEYRPYNPEWQVEVTWEDCALRAYLNNDFYNSLSADTKARIVETLVVNEDNSMQGTVGGADTTDKIFLLSLSEAETYFGNVLESWKNEDGSFESQMAGVAYDLEGNAANWWLRTPGSTNAHACFVGVSGGMTAGASRFTTAEDYGVRPAMWVELP